MTAPGSGDERERGLVHVITGGGGGIAVATARRLGQRGTVLLSDMSSERVEDAAGRLRAEGLDVHTTICDVADAGSVRELAARTRELGRLGAFVHAAAVSPPTFTDPRGTIEIDLVATASLLEAFEPLVVEGSVGVCLASLGGHRGFARRFDELLADPLVPGFAERLLDAADCRENPVAVYALAKHGVMVLCERHASSWGQRGGRLVSVSPGHIADTTMGQTLAGSAYLDVSALGRTGRAVEVAGLIAFLCSDDASYITGCDISVDGGVRGTIVSRPPAVRDAWHAVDVISPD